MLTYLYKCDNCELEFQCQQSIKDNPLKECPACEQKTLQRGVG